MHFLYVFVGTVINYLALFWWNLRDRINPPKSDSVLFVAHPDDDTLFFHTFLKEKKPYVCLMTTGWSLRRMPDFIKCMKQYGVRFRAYPLESRDKRMNRLEKQVRTVLSLGSFHTVATHNATGEYGHEEHRRVHDAVINVCKDNPAKMIFCPADVSEIRNYPLSPDLIKEKQDIFQKIYITETWVLDEEAAGTPVWVTHEQLIQQ